ncbi:aminoglycoside phosphotransferase family protein [Embleya sp. NPDC008237]|uniref:aminoglycoside phosphotransferase family protein n=1 Tax=Embleya sp. NPDC008237 TaxID=3363978 RepID=UPI0036E39A35
MSTPISVDVPTTFVESYGRQGASARAWLDALPGLAADLLDRWTLCPDGPTAHGMAALVLPVIRADGTPAALRLRQPTEDDAGVALGLRTWNGDGVVHLLDHDPDSGAMLLERLDASRTLSAVPDDDVAMRTLAELAARLVAVPAPPGLRHLAQIAADMLDRAPHAVPALRDPAERRLVRTCASAVAELIDEPGDRLLHWDLHYDNVLAADREPWLVIDPEPLAGDPGFELWPALDSRWEAVVATGDATRTLLRRFDLLTEVLDLDRRRAAGWTLARVLQNALWDIEDGRSTLEPAQVTLAEALLGR